MVAEWSRNCVTSRHFPLAQSPLGNARVSQVEGAFVMGLGLWTSEHLVHEPASGRLLTDSSWLYKPPGAQDIPRDLRVAFRRNSRNAAGVLGSKGTWSGCSGLRVAPRSLDGSVRCRCSDGRAGPGAGGGRGAGAAPHHPRGQEGVWLRGRRVAAHTWAYICSFIMYTYSSCKEVDYTRTSFVPTPATFRRLPFVLLAWHFGGHPTLFGISLYVRLWTYVGGQVCTTPLLFSRFRLTSYFFAH